MKGTHQTTGLSITTTLTAGEEGRKIDCKCVFYCVCVCVCACVRACVRACVCFRNASMYVYHIHCITYIHVVCCMGEIKHSAHIRDVCTLVDNCLFPIHISTNHVLVHELVLLLGDVLLVIKHDNELYSPFDTRIHMRYFVSNIVSDSINFTSCHLDT